MNNFYHFLVNFPKFYSKNRSNFNNFNLINILDAKFNYSIVYDIKPSFNQSNI